MINFHNNHSINILLILSSLQLKSRPQGLSSLWPLRFGEVRDPGNETIFPKMRAGKLKLQSKVKFDKFY